MADLKDVVEAILTDLIAVRHSSNKYSQILREEYLEDEGLSNYGAPAVDIGNVKLELRFVLEEPDPDADTPGATLEPEDVSRVVRASVADVLGSSDVKYQDASDNLANRKNIYARIAEMILGATDTAEFKVDQSEVVESAVEFLRPHLARDPRGRPASLAATRDLMNQAIGLTESKLSEALDAARKSAVARPRFVVDINKLKSLDPEMIATISFDLDMTNVDWHEVEQD